MTTIDFSPGTKVNFLSSGSTPITGIIRDESEHKIIVEYQASPSQLVYIVMAKNSPFHKFVVEPDSLISGSV